MKLSAAQKKHLKNIGIQLDPVIYIAEDHLSENAIAETDRALKDHELIKVKFHSDDREQRLAQLNALREQIEAEVIQSIGKIAVLYRHNPEVKPRLSNVQRYQRRGSH